MWSIWEALQRGLTGEDPDIAQAAQRAGLTHDVLDRLVGNFDGSGDYSLQCAEVLSAILPRAVTVMALKKPVKILIEGLDEEMDVLAAKFEGFPDQGLFHLRLPAEIFVEASVLENQPLPLNIQLENAVWLNVQHVDGNGVAHAVMAVDEIGMVEDLNAASCWVPATEQEIQSLNLKNSLIRTGQKKDRGDWIRMLESGLPSRSVWTYPSLETALEGGSGFVLMQKVGLAHAHRQDDGSYSVVLLRKLHTMGYEAMPTDFGELLHALSESPVPTHSKHIGFVASPKSTEGKDFVDLQDADANAITEPDASTLPLADANAQGHPDVNAYGNTEDASAPRAAVDADENADVEADVGVGANVEVPTVNADTTADVAPCLAVELVQRVAAEEDKSTTQADPVPLQVAAAKDDEDSYIVDGNGLVPAEAVLPVEKTTGASGLETVAPPATRSAETPSVAPKARATPFVATGEPDESAEGLTMAQRRDMKKKREEEAKKKRLQDYITSGTSQSTGDEVNVGIKNRFELAKKKQQEQEEERLARIKSDTTRKLVFSTGGSRWAGGEADNNPSPGTQAIGSSDVRSPPATVIEKQGSSKSMRNLWEGVLNESKNTEQSRYKQTRLSTISQFRLTDGTGIVKSRVGEWEELFLQIAVTQEQMNEFLAAAQALTARLESGSLSHEERLAAQERFRESCLVPEDFVINDTHVYSSADLDHFLHSFLKKLLTESKAAHVPLSCGVYGDTDAKPPIEVFATAIKTSEGKIYVSVTVKAAADRELDLAVYGVRKICVVSKDQKLFEKLLNVVPEPWMMPSIAGYVPMSYNAETQHMEEVAADFHIPIDGQTGARAGDAQHPDADYEGAEVTHDLDEIMQSVSCHAQSAAVDAAVEGAERANVRPDAEETSMQSQEKVTQSTEVSHESSPALEVEQAIAKVELVVPEGWKAPDEQKPLDVPHITADESVGCSTGDVSLPAQKVVEVEQLSLPDLPPPPSPSDPAPATPAVPEGASAVQMAVTTSRRSSRRRAGSAASVASADDEGEGEGIWTTNPTPNRHASGDCQSVDEFEDPLDEEMRRAAEEDDREGGGHGHGAAGSLFQSDNEDDDDDATLEGEDEDDGQPNQFGRCISLPYVGTPRLFAPAPIAKNSFAKSAHTAHKFSWQVEEEIESGLPMVDHAAITADLSQFTSFSCCTNLFSLRGLTHSLMFTGTLKHASVESQYLVEGDRIFEWIRGAAASGWLTKWPMKSQSFGRVRKRFFVLRDNLLSYFTSKPRSEEEIQATFSRNTLHLTDNTSVAVGRKFLTRCVVISTPIDTLWVRMRGDFSSQAAKWMNELNKAIQYQQRQKYFMTKQRLESKWFHESVSFSLRGVDALTTEAGGYVKAALFRMAVPVVAGGSVKPIDPPVSCMYAVDIASSEVPRCQLEVVSETGTSMLPSDLNVIKIYGGVVILGGSHGFLGLGLVSRTVAGAEEPAKADPIAQAGHGPRRALFCWPCQAPPEEGEPVAVAAEASALRRQSFSAGQSLPPYPHATTSGNYITALAVGKHSAVFAAADSTGTISLWSLPRSKYLHTLNPHSVLSNRSMQTVMRKLRPRLIDSISTSHLSHEQGQVFDKPPTRPVESTLTPERVVKLQFAVKDNYLIVSTQRRLLLLTLRTQVVHDLGRGMSISELRGVSFAEGQDPFDPQAAMQAKVAVSTRVLGFASWVEMDRALPGLGAVFDVHVEEGSSGMRTKPDQGVLASLARNSVTLGGAPVPGMDYGSRPVPHAGMSFVEWRMVENDDPSPSAGSSFFGVKAEMSTAKRCTVSRVVWTEVMISAAVERAKPCI